MNSSLKKSITLKANTNTSSNSNAFSQELNANWLHEPVFDKSTFLNEWCKANLGHPIEHSLIISKGRSGYIDLSTISDITNFPEYIRMCNA